MITQNHRHLLFIATIMLFGGLLFCRSAKTLSESTLQQTLSGCATLQPSTSPKHLMVIFIHGTLVPLPSRSGISKCLATFFDHKKNMFQEYMDASRMGGIYQYQPIGEYGLKPINPETTCSIGCHWTTQTCNHVYGLVDDYAHRPVSFYTFGWSGALSQESRVHYGRQLYQELSKEIETVLTQQNITRDDLEVIIMAHSHGGNVALNMATCCDAAPKTLVDQLILIGTPVQDETQGFVSNPLFKSVYHFYSEGDSIQTLDFISTKGTSSHRFNRATDEKLTQVEVVIGQKSPMHNELWFFKGYKNILYRGSLAIQPLPFFVFIPFVLQKKVFEGIGQAHDLELTLDCHDKVFDLVLKERKQNYPIRKVKISTIPQSCLNVPEMAHACHSC